MNLLLDSHVLLWFVADDPRLGARARETIISPTNTVAVSTASVWELSIKQSLGKLRLPPGFVDALREDFEILPVTMEHALGVADLPLHHRDPFDRLLVAQCQAEGLTLVTSDSIIGRYAIATLSAS